MTQFPPINSSRKLPVLFLIFTFLLAMTAACQLPGLSHGKINVTIQVNGSERQATLEAGSTVADALSQLGITPDKLDKSTPPMYTVLTDGDRVEYIHVEEVFKTEEVVIPYEQQFVRNESLPEGETRLIQSGSNGLEEITYRIVSENGEEVSKSIVKTIILVESIPEILMVGAQSSFAPIPIPGTIAYLAGGNAWLMTGTTANRRIIVSSGDLDGRIFSLSYDRKWLLFSRKSTKSPDQEINTLWVINIANEFTKPQDLKAPNVVHFADFKPGNNTEIYYSTVEPRAQAPGWQANNDLQKVIFGLGWVGDHKKILDPNSGGVYGWWGTNFAWSQNGRLAYTRPDGFGIVDIDGGYLKPLLEITPLQTQSDWAWIPGLTWGADEQSIYFVSHAPPSNLINQEVSPNFDLCATLLANNTTITMSEQTGMFAYPAASALRLGGKENYYQVAYLQAIFPIQSETSRYRLFVMDRDGSDRRVIFPPDDTPGMEPQRPVWAPDPIDGQNGDFMAVTYQGNLWLIDSGSGQSFQITGDGLISRIDWK
ncbi:MAG: G5 domain-containing protein [Anaerolineales bacterium]|nr:G5 domain-containing protein [Anaerolineales bacterium]